MKTFIAGLLERLTESLNGQTKNAIPTTTSEAIEKPAPESPIIQRQTIQEIKKKPANTPKKTSVDALIPYSKDIQDIRDIMLLMESPFVALSKNRTEPIIYESADGRSKVRVSAHRDHYVASIYDWDIVIFVASKMQEFMNAGDDIPSRSIIVPRHEMFKTICRDGGKGSIGQVEAALNRLGSTFIETTLNNEDYRYKGGFSFLDNWGYTERKDIKEFRITLSEWLYDTLCQKGSLLKVSPGYFKLTSGLKRFLYRTARKHVGTHNPHWKFSLEALYAKSGSEQELRFFKRDLKKAVSDNDIPEYFMQWIEEDGKTFIRFSNKKKDLKKMIAEQ